MTTEKVRVGEVLTLERSPIEIVAETSYRRIGIYSWGKGFLHRPAVPGTEMGSMRYFTFPPGALVLSNIQAWEAAVAVSGASEEGHVASNRFLTYVPTSRDVDVRYLLHYFLSEVGLEALRRASPGTQVRNRTLGKQLFENLVVPLPSIGEQRRIATHLDSVQTQVQRMMTERESLVAERVTSAVLAKMFSGQSDGRMLGDVASVARGSVARLEAGGAGFVGQAAVRWEGVDLTRLKGADHLWEASCPDAKRTQLGEVLLNSTGEGTLGRACVVSQEAVGLVTDSKVLTVRTSGELRADFLVAYLASPQGQQQLNGMKGANTTKQTELGVARAQSLRVPLIARDQQDVVMRGWLKARDRLDSLGRLAVRRDTAIESILPAARNEIFSAMR